jgi:hypothetical protein
MNAIEHGSSCRGHATTSQVRVRVSKNLEGAYLLRPGPDKGGSQALDLAPAQGGFVEFTPAEPGNYTFVSHKFNDASRGALGIFQVGDLPSTMSH